MEVNMSVEEYEDRYDEVCIDVNALYLQDDMVDLIKRRAKNSPNLNVISIDNSHICAKDKSDIIEILDDIESDVEHSKDMVEETFTIREIGADLGDEVPIMTEYGDIQKAKIIDFDKDDVRVKMLDGDKYTGVDEGDVTWLPSDDIKRAKELAPVPFRRLRNRFKLRQERDFDNFLDYM